MKLDQFIAVMYVISVRVVAIVLHACDKYLLQCVWSEDLVSDLTLRSKTAKPNKLLWEECEGVYKRPHLQKRAM